MSNATLSIREYELAAELSESLAFALLDLNKLAYGFASISGVSPLQLDASRRTALGIVDAIAAELQDGVATPGLRRLPQGLAKQFSDDAVTPADLAMVRFALTQKQPLLGRGEMATLETISDIIDSFTRELFRRLVPTGAAN